ncbi:MAG TPA: ribosome biogenesis GTPase Der [Gemmatales bacterium]|nr:ribosome biogenesis GTPase Der [Gemmatales bacterium]HMP59043.1 ribosome biogenesis GTPase Der [Gemmatales bacterium]
MPLPQVAIVGRPNVGKSSLFNALAGIRIAIVEPTPGVTRDRLAFPLEVRPECFVELVDTGGMGILDKDNLTDDVEQQIARAIDQSDLILFVVDVREGLTPLDRHVSDRLRGVGKPVILVVNKCDTDRLETDAENFRALGWEPILFVSAHQGRGRSLLLNAIAEQLGSRLTEEAPPAEPVMKIAIVGRRNTGKSTFINQLAQAERVIVSEVPGTTRDSIDVRFERDGLTFIAIDTAGVRKARSLQDSIEFYSLARAQRSIRRADVVLHFFDPTDVISQVDKELTSYIIAEQKPAIFVVNKWDLVKDRVATEQWADYLRKTLGELDYVPISFVTAKDGRNVQRLLNLAQNLFKQSTTRLRTGELNRLIREALTRRPPPVRQNRTPRVFYATQVAIQPPTIVCFTNGPQMFDEWYQRYLLRQVRQHSPLAEVPIKLLLRLRGEDEGRGRGERDPAVEESKPSGRRTTRTAAAAVKAKKQPPPWKRKKSKKPDVWHDV